MPEPITTAAIVAAVAAKNGMPKTQLEAIVGGMSDEQREHLSDVVATKGDVLGMFEAIRDYRANAEAKELAKNWSAESEAAYAAAAARDPESPLVVGPPMNGAPRLSSEGPVGPPRAE